ncbi:MAG: hypothetical protein WBF43_04105 [Methylocella sp.]
MPAKIHVVKLKKQDRQRVKGSIRKGKSRAAHILKARILLKADDGRHGKDGRFPAGGTPPPPKPGGACRLPPFWAKSGFAFK